MTITLAACAIVYPWITDIVGSKRTRSMGVCFLFALRCTVLVGTLQPLITCPRICTKLCTN